MKKKKKIDMSMRSSVSTYLDQSHSQPGIDCLVGVKN
jgi:hypothetical protein